MKLYHAIIVLGYGFAKNWDLALHQKKRLGKVASLYQKKIAPKIIVCGKWSINWDLEKITPPTTEAELMRKYLLQLKVPDSSIIKEEYSKDTIGNAFFSKTKIVEALGAKKLLVVCADFHLKRTRYLFKKIYFEKFYQIDFLATKTQFGKDPHFLELQETILKRQKKFIEEVEKEGLDKLNKYLYHHPYYQKKRPDAIAKAAKGETR